MPINVFANLERATLSHEEPEPIAWLCDAVWELPTQLFEFEQWLETAGKNLPKGSYIADIGFRLRADASGGGGTLSVSAMQTLVKVGMEIWFSEYTE